MLDAAEGGDLVRKEAGVDPDHAVFERFGDAEATADVARVEVRGQARFGGVGQGDGFLFAGEAVKGGDRAEDLFAREAHRGRDAGEHGRLEESAAERVTAPAEQRHGAVPERVGEQGFDLVQRGRVDQRPLGDPGAFARADCERGDAVGEAVREFVVDAGLDVEAVGADAGLPGVAELGGERAFDRGVEVRVVEDDEGGVAAEFERELLHRRRALRHEQAPDLGRAGEREFAHRRIGAQLAADRGRLAGDHVEHPGRQAGLLGQRGQRQGAERRLFGRLDHRRAAGGERRRNLARNHGEREIPGRDRGDDADRLADRDQPLVARRAGDALAVGALAFLGEPFEERGGVGHFAARLGERLARFGGDQPGEVVLVREQACLQAHQQGGALLGRGLPPGGQRGFGGGDRAPGFGSAHQRNFGEAVAASRIAYRETAAVVGGEPAVADAGQGTEEVGTGERQ